LSIPIVVTSCLLGGSEPVAVPQPGGIAVGMGSEREQKTQYLQTRSLISWPSSGHRAPPCMIDWVRTVWTSST